MEHAELIVRRGGGYADRLRAYTIKIDGVAQGSLKPNSSLTIPVAFGSHVLSAALDWCGSNEIVFEAKPAPQLLFECANNLRGWRLNLALFYVLFRRNQYLSLRQVF